MATLDVTIKESVTLNGKDRGSENVLSITSVNEVLHRIVTCPANEDTTVALFKSAVGVSLEERGRWISGMSSTSV